MSSVPDCHTGSDLCWHVSILGVLHHLPYPCCTLDQEPSVVFNCGCALVSWDQGVGGWRHHFNSPGAQRHQDDWIGISGEGVRHQHFLRVPQLMPACNQFENHWLSNHLQVSSCFHIIHTYAFECTPESLGQATFHLSPRFFRRCWIQP